MGSEQRRGHEDTGCFAAVFGIVFFSILSASLGYSAGFDTGAIAVHSGEYVVVRLPDGTDRVVKVMKKETPHAQ